MSGKLKEEEKKKIIAAVKNLDLSNHPEWWSALDTLSNRTQFDGLEVFEDEIILEPGKGRKFHGNANVYVVLVYGGANDETSLSDAFPLQFKGHLVDGDVKIDDVVVDTTSFGGEVTQKDD